MSKSTKSKKPSPKIERVGRLCYWVRSNSRAGLRHYVDLEGDLDDTGKLQRFGEPSRCSCESFELRADRPCRHIRDVVEFILDALGFSGQDLILADEMLSHGMIPTEVVRYMLKKQATPKPQPDSGRVSILENSIPNQSLVRQYELKPRSSIGSKMTK